MSLSELPPGQEKVAGPRWWTRVSYVGLVILALAAVAALVVGFVASRAISSVAEIPASVEPTGSADGPLAAECRPPVDRATQEPWIGPQGRENAEAAWQQHADELSETYVVGPNGWIFWSDYVEQYASQAVGRATLTQSQIDNWIDYYSSIRDGLAAEGIEFYIAVTPSTSSVYPEELPTWMQELRGSTIMDQFMAAATDLPVIDMRADLIAAKGGDHHVFSWSNSHWTEYGGYIGWQRIAQCINAHTPEDAPLQVPELAGVEVVGDFNEWAPWGVASPGADWARPIFATPLQDVDITDKSGVPQVVPGAAMTDPTVLPATTTVAESWTGKSALIVRDSMASAISPYLQQAYSPTWQEWHLYDSFDIFPKYRQLVAEHHPDVVILQLAERHFIQVPPAGAGY